MVCALYKGYKFEQMDLSNLLSNVKVCRWHPLGQGHLDILHFVCQLQMQQSLQVSGHQFMGPGGGAEHQRHTDHM